MNNANQTSEHMRQSFSPLPVSLILSEIHPYHRKFLQNPLCFLTATSWSTVNKFLEFALLRSNNYYMIPNKKLCLFLYVEQAWYRASSPSTAQAPFLLPLLGLCVRKSCEKCVKKGTMWNQCWQKYKFTTSAFHMHVKFCNTCENFLSYVWTFFPCILLHVKSFHACETILSCLVMHVNFKFHMHNRCYAACEHF